MSRTTPVGTHRNRTLSADPHTTVNAKDEARLRKSAAVLLLLTAMAGHNAGSA